MAVPMSRPLPVERMRPTAGRQGLLRLREVDNCLQLAQILALLLNLWQVSFKRGCGEKKQRHRTFSRTSRKELTRLSVAGSLAFVIAATVSALGTLTGKRESLVQFDLLEKEPNRFRCRNAKLREDTFGRPLQLGIDPGTDHLGFSCLLPHIVLLHGSVTQDSNDGREAAREHRAVRHQRNQLQGVEKNVALRIACMG